LLRSRRGDRGRAATEPVDVRLWSMSLAPVTIAAAARPRAATRSASNLLPIAQLGARERTAQRGVIDFGVHLPGIDTSAGTLLVRIIHERDQFIADIPAVEVTLTHGALPGLPDVWTGSVDTNDTSIAPAQSRGWGTPTGEQRYLYRYAFKRPNGDVIDDIIDPFAREFGPGKLAAITVGYVPFTFDAASEAAFTVPRIGDAIVYELNIAELGGSVDACIELLDYLRDLGVNVIEVMPVSNVASRIDWGYAPLGYFGVDERLGKRRDFQRFVAEAHARQIAVVIDSVFGHVEGRFPYSYLYRALNEPSPMIGPYGKDIFFESTDFRQPLTRQFFQTVCAFWLDVFHVDGFRYDAVSQYWEEKATSGERGFEDLVQAVGDIVESGRGQTAFARFYESGDPERRLIQIAEFLSDAPPEHVLYDTVANSNWQDDTLRAAQRCARGEPGAITELGHRFGLINYPATRTQGGVAITKSGLQYIESHDHERFICNYGTHFPDDDSAARNDDLLRVGNRDQSWFKIQPYLIGIMTARGTPFIWQGQEFCQDYYVPSNGSGRVLLYRPVDFNYFYDPIGKSLIQLVRKLSKIRHAGPELRSNEHFFHDRAEYTNQGLLVFERGNATSGPYTLVALNFTDQDRSATFTFKRGGTYKEQLHGTRDLTGVTANTPHGFTVPSNYGCIWTLE
jgi:maltooligosyltrehalose trehalohydrolase